VKLLREPLLQLAVAGALLFGGHALLTRGDTDAAPEASRQIRIGEGEARWLKETWALQRAREPTPEELRTLIAEFANELMLAREAREMKLDDNDTVIRRRLAQKLTFLIEDTLRRAEPSDADLQQLYEQRRQQPRSSRISFTHIYFNPFQRSNAAADARAVLAELLNGKAAKDEEVGDRFLLASEFRDENGQSLGAIFGPDFARAVFALQPGVWSGPVDSGFGVHLVKVSAVRAAASRTFADMRPELVEEWRHNQEQVARERYFAELRKKYDIVFDDAVKALLAPAANAAGQRP
jgi:parvulin-like peptidyl-prolyl isomerase